MENEFKFINQKEIYQYKFYMIPKELFVNERYTSLSPTAILLYGILLDRLTLSIKKNWIDKNGNVYLIFTRKEIQKLLHISDKTCTKVFKELVDAKLLLEKSQGKAKPKLLYPAQMIHDVKFDNLTRKNSDSQSENFTAHESKNLRPIYTDNKYTNKAKHNSWHYENERHYSEEFLNSLYANLID
ncbi:MAG: replication initiator protein A [Clostridia bacterium]